MTTRLLIPLFLLSASLLTTADAQGRPASPAQSEGDRYVALSAGARQPSAEVSYFGVPFITGTLDQPSATPRSVSVGGRARRIFLLGMDESANIRAWADPRDQSVRFFIGDTVGEIRLDYEDGSFQTFPLVLGESVWWGRDFYEFPEPFPHSVSFRQALRDSLRLYPAEPNKDGRYIAVITPKPLPIRKITLSDSPAKKGSVDLQAITAETDPKDDTVRGTGLSPAHIGPELQAFIRTRSLRAGAQQQATASTRLTRLATSLYTSNIDFQKSVPLVIPSGFAGPHVSFKGDIFASILTNAFYANVADILSKVDGTGMYHTSSAGAISWGGRGFGTYKTGAGMYFGQSWSRDLGRSLHELTELGYLQPGLRCSQYCFRTERVWHENPSLLFHGQRLPDHWGRIANRPDAKTPFENDGEGLIGLYLYSLWQHVPNQREWLLSNWGDLKSVGDSILWQFDHPDLSGASQGVLYTTGESAAGKGYSVFADYICMDALQALTQMADSIGQSSAAELWRKRAGAMHDAIAQRYIVEDPRYGKVWTLTSAGWPNQSTVLGPLIFHADFGGFAPEDQDPAFRNVNAAAYQRLLDSYKPFGFYGQAMGYGQGFVTESALLLDRMRDATEMLRWTAKQIYDPKYGSFIVPEGVQIEPGGKYWYRTGDLGNGVQEAEIIKTLRLVIGVDDVVPSRLRIFPRLPYNWTGISVSGYPALIASDRHTEVASVRYTLRRVGKGLAFTLSSDRPLGLVKIRLGPFAARPRNTDVSFNGRRPANISIERSGDSWWVRFDGSVKEARNARDSAASHPLHPFGD